MRRSFKEVVLVLVALGIVFGVTLACGSTESEPSDSAAQESGAAAGDATVQESSAAGSTQPEAAASAQDTTTAQDPVANSEPAEKVESLLSGETLARYRALPG
ncbi:MAG: hypothetical protein OXD46_06495, partial [Chloroflexi bacterium]|nr:hypothetical protein [Chloroflexota bacterium]